MKIPFIGQAYENRIVPVSNQRCINFYPEIEPSDARNVITLQSVSGTQSFATIVDSAYVSIRGMHFNEKNQKLYVVTNTDLYEVDEVGNVSASLGTIGGGDISMTDDGDNIVITTGTEYYYYEISSGTLATVANGVNADDCTFQDGYILYTRSNTDTFYWSDVNDAQTITATNFLSSNSSTDLVVGLEQVERRIWVWGTDSITIWYNSGRDTPWSLVEGGSSNGFGLAGKQAKAVLDSRVYWVSNDGKIYVSNGYTPQPISHFGVENSMRKYGDITDCRASAWSENGHKFVSFTFPTGDETWVYDVTTQMWHQRSSYVESNTKPGAWSAVDVTRAWRRNIVGDSTYGRLGRLDVDLYTEYGGDLVSRRTSPVIHSNQNVITHDRLEILFNAGDTDYAGDNQSSNWSKVGNSKELSASSVINAVTALTDTRIALFSSVDGLAAYDWDGVSFTKVGNTLPLASIGGGAETTVSIDKLSSTRIAFIGLAEKDLRSFDFDGTDWTAHSADLNISDYENGSLTALSSTTVAIATGSTSDYIETYTLSGTTWSQTFNTFALPAGTNLAYASAMSSTRIALWILGDDTLTAYDWDGTDWTKKGNSLSIPYASGSSAVAAITSSAVVITNTDDNAFKTYEFDGTDWAASGNSVLFTTGSTIVSDVDLLTTDIVIVTEAGSSSLMTAYSQTAIRPSPRAQLRWSDDGGNTWGNWIFRDIGRIGEYRNRSVWYRLGQTQNRVYDVRISDDTARSIIDVVLEGDGGEI